MGVYSLRTIRILQWAGYPDAKNRFCIDDGHRELAGFAL